MIPDLFAENLTMDVNVALAGIRSRIPELEDVARAFAILIDERRSLVLDGVQWPKAVDFDATAFSSGVPLLANQDLSGLQGCYLSSAEKLLPVLERAFPSIGSSAASLQSGLIERPDLAHRCLEMILTGDLKVLEATAQAAGVAVEVLSFLVLEIVKPCLRQAAVKFAHLADNELWYKGYCPVCGGGPDIGFLKDKRDPSEFLISKTGQLWPHCSLCGHIWRFVRLVCPSCGQTDHERLDVFTAQGREKERIHACRDCKRYVLVIDLVGSNEKLDPDMAPIGLIHLDILAQERGYSPLARTPWNLFR
ncbi:conserved hypothetical protein [uncultured Desulfobacterium sp.]|uniref:Formate dehydrogenase accessory protein FdhE n=1 Tax=uncultured Desulfobacterium sp. TaxID=201089 RepID=A0A445N2E9_9BACT|nr:conserved hypothetical protein [uncultured Desulfobacterium sp.]